MTRPPLLIKNARVVDPADGRDETGDLFVMEGILAPIPKDLPPTTEIIDAEGLTAAPGFMDIHVHFREPGKETAETIETGSAAAAHGGFTTVLCMPNTKPALDEADRVRAVLDKGRAAGKVRVLSSACITRDRASAKLTDMRALADAGASAFTDDGSTVHSREHMHKAMEIAAELGLPILDHAEDPAEDHRGVMHAGRYATRYNLPGIPAHTESRIVLRDIELAEQTGCRTHIQHVSAKDSVELLRRAQTRDIPVTGELTPHHATLTDGDVDPDNANYKMNPPLRSGEDQAALLTAVIDGTLSAFATDHAPHTAEEKKRGFLKAPFGIVGLETAIGVTFTAFVASGKMSLGDWITRWTAGPADILNIPQPTLRAGSPADIVLLDLATSWTVDPTDFFSKSCNTPYEGRELIGRAVCTICDGTMTYRDKSLS